MSSIFLEQENMKCPALKTYAQNRSACFESLFGNGADKQLVTPLVYEDHKGSGGQSINGHYSPLVQTDVLLEPAHLVDAVRHLYPSGTFPEYATRLN